MPTATSPPPAAVPRWLAIVGSIAIVLHLGAVLARVLSASSGPWINSEGPGLAPAFAAELDGQITRNYLDLVRLTHNYHFPSDRLAVIEFRVEFKLKDKEGKEIATVQFPDPKANSWVRYRQSMLAGQLGQDSQLPPPGSEEIAPPGRLPEEITIWKGTGNYAQIAKAIKHELPHDQPISQPSPWSLLVAKSLVRSLCQEYGATSAEVTRYARQPVPSPFMQMPDRVRDDYHTDRVASFGEIRP